MVIFYLVNLLNSLNSGLKEILKKMLMLSITNITLIFKNHTQMKNLKYARFLSELIPIKHLLLLPVGSQKVF